MSTILACSGGCNILAAGNTGNDSGQKHWNGSNGTPAVATSAPWTAGNSYLQFVAAATAPYLFKNSPASTTYAGMRGILRVSAAPSSTVTVAKPFQGGGTEPALQVTTGLVLQITWGGSGTQTGPTLVAGRSYAIEVEWDVHANPNVIQWRVKDLTGGGSWTNQTNGSFAQAATTADGQQLGIVSGPTSGVTVEWESVAMWAGTSSAYLASAKDRYVYRLLPNVDGTHSFTAGDFKKNNSTNVGTSDTDVYTYLDDPDQTSLSDYISQNVIRTTGYVEVGFQDPPSTHTPIAVAITATLHAASTAADQASIKVSDDSFSHTNTLLSNDDVSDTTAHYRHLLMDAKPSDSGAWTNAALVALKARLGYSGDVTDIPFFDSISVEYLYEDSYVPPAAFIGGGFF